jgi:hypothetical protein
MTRILRPPLLLLNPYLATILTADKLFGGDEGRIEAAKAAKALALIPRPVSYPSPGLSGPSLQDIRCDSRHLSESIKACHALRSGARTASAALPGSSGRLRGSKLRAQVRVPRSAAQLPCCPKA